MSVVEDPDRFVVGGVGGPQDRARGYQFGMLEQRGAAVPADRVIVGFAGLGPSEPQPEQRRVRRAGDLEAGGTPLEPVHGGLGQHPV